MASSRELHWDEVYATKSAETMSWFEEEPAISLAMIAATGLGKSAAIVDIGGGASLLVDRLIEQGHARVAVLDISATGLEVAKARLDAQHSKAGWILADVTHWEPPRGTFDLWHDRAVFHFLTDDADRAGYLKALERGLKPGGFVILATFALTGPAMCSGLPVRRYSAATLHAALGPDYELMESKQQAHRTPAGTAQDFLWCRFRKSGAEARIEHRMPKEE